MTQQTRFEIKSFEELSKHQLYEIMALRIEVFCVEQECFYQDLDHLDQTAKHIMIYQDQNLVAYCRILEKNKDTLSIGRVVVPSKHRGKGYAQDLMAHSIDYCKKQKDFESIQISAQTYLKSFYSNLGFKSMNEYYLEDDIPHEKMIFQLA